MSADVRAEAGSLLQVRTQMTRADVQRNPQDAWPGAVIRLGPDFRQLENVAFIEAGAAEGMKKSGWRHLTLWADAARQAAIVVVDTETADGGRASYRVLDPSGLVLARVVRHQGSVTGFRRTRWTVETSGATTMHAVKGSVFGWSVWWALSPLWAVLTPLTIVGADVARMPLTTVFHSTQGQELFRYVTVSGTDHDFRTAVDWPDPRVLFAMAALHNTHISWRDRPDAPLTPQQLERWARA